MENSGLDLPLKILNLLCVLTVSFMWHMLYAGVHISVNPGWWGSRSARFLDGGREWGLHEIVLYPMTYRYMR